MSIKSLLVGDVYECADEVIRVVSKHNRTTAEGQRYFIEIYRRVGITAGYPLFAIERRSMTKSTIVRRFATAKYVPPGSKKFCFMCKECFTKEEGSLEVLRCNAYHRNVGGD